MRRDFRRVHWTFLGPEDEKTWYGILLLHKWCNGSLKQVTQFSHVPVPWVVESWGSWKEKEPYISMRIIRTQSSHSESFILPISSVSTEQFPNGVKSSVWSLKKEDQNSQTENSVKREFWRAWIHRKWNLWCSKDESSIGERIARNFQNFKSLSRTIQFTRICVLASFWHRVDVGLKYKTIPEIIPAWHTSSTRPEFQRVCGDSRRNSDWTSSQSSHRSSSSWKTWTWNQNSISEWSTPNILGCDMPRKD